MAYVAMQADGLSLRIDVFAIVATKATGKIPVSAGVGKGTP